MNDSPLVSPNIKEYCEKHKMQRVLNYAIQEVLFLMPSDPFSGLSSKFKEYCLSIFQVRSITIQKKLNSDFNYQLVIDITLEYQGDEQKAISYFIPLNSNIYESVTSNMDHYIELYESIFKKSLEGYNIEQFGAYDKLILSQIKQEELGEDKDIVYSISNALSISTFLAMSNIANCTCSEYIYSNTPQFTINGEKITDIGFVIFKTGKTMNSKVKFERFIIFIDKSNAMSFDALMGLLSNLYQSIRKFLTAGKLGENGMRLNPENSYYPPTDTLNDIFKLIENIITECNANGQLYYGIDCHADNYYSKENNQYEMDGFKKPPDLEQLIDFYIKMCNDHPLLKYLEDPIASTDVKGWNRLIEKFTETKPEVIISGKELFNEDIAKVSEFLDETKEEEEEKDNNGQPQIRTTDPNYRSKLINNIPRPEDVKEELTELEKKKIEEEEKKKKEEEELAKKLAEEEEEKKKMEEAKKPGKKVDNTKKTKKEDDNKKTAQGNVNSDNKEEEKKEPSLLPLKVKSLSMRIGKFKVLSDYFDIIQKVKQKKCEVTLYDNTNESEQSAVVDIGLGTRVSKIILHGFTIKKDKMAKIIQYIYQTT